MATITFEIANKDIARLLTCLSESDTESTISVRIRMARRRKGEYGPIELVWQVKFLPDNGGIYRILMEGGQDEKGIYDYKG